MEKLNKHFATIDKNYIMLETSAIDDISPIDSKTDSTVIKEAKA